LAKRFIEVHFKVWEKARKRLETGEIRNKAVKKIFIKIREKAIRKKVGIKEKRKGKDGKGKES
jgi:hypothetical protein